MTELPLLESGALKAMNRLGHLVAALVLLIGVPAGAGDISADPLFADPARGDFHLKSQRGRWTPAGWVTDPVTSPAIGAGECGVEMGAYGQTPEASQ